MSGIPLPPARNWLHALSSNISVGNFLVIFSPFLTTLTAAMIIGNFMVYLVPAARRAMNSEDKTFPGTDYSTAQRQLWRFTYLSATIAFPLLVVGAFLL
jgi:hypothetical protein